MLTVSLCVYREGNLEHVHVSVGCTTTAITKHLYNICSTLDQRRPMLYTCYTNVLCFLELVLLCNVHSYCLLALHGSSVILLLFLCYIITHMCRTCLNVIDKNHYRSAKAY